jgi:multimeric flavodoxin WrbA
MKALGLSYGRPNGNSEVLAKEALMEVKKVTGAEVDIIRILDLTIKPCTGCESCMIRNQRGEDGLCHQKGDHMSFLLDKIAESDGVIFSAPAYVLMPPGLLILIANRMLGSGKAFREKNMEKPKVRGVITLGGTDWTNLVLPLTVLSSQMMAQGKLVDQMLVEYIPRPAQVVLRDEALARAKKLGNNVGKAMKMPFEKVKYVGDEEETCPVCHSNLISIRGKEVECPYCDIRGTIDTSGKKLKVIFSDEELQKQRFGPWGSKRHGDAIRDGHNIFNNNRDLIREKLEKYKDFGKISKPPALGK